MRLKLTVLVTGLLIGAAQSAHAQQAIKIGYVDYYRVINESVEGRKANDRLESEFEPIKNDLKAREDSLMKLEQEIKRQKDVLSKDTLREKADELQIKLKSYYREKREAQERFSVRNKELLKPLLIKLKEVVAEVGKKGNYTLIFENSSESNDLAAIQTNIIYASPAIDITDEVLKEFNSRPPAPVN